MSSPVYELLKRPDELFVVEHAHLQPRFVEDSVRIALATTLERFPDLADADFLYSRQVNIETIHAHDVLAERYGTVGEMRAELAGGARPARHTRSTSGCVTETTHAPDPTPARRLGRPWHVIVLNDNHNTFDGVAFALASTIPGVDFEEGLALADRIHNAGRAAVSGAATARWPSSTGSGSRAWA